MSGTFSGIEMAGRALQAQQSVLDVIGHNVSNVNTPGYSRQVAELAATPPVGVETTGFTDASGQIGTGVQLLAVNSVRDQYLDSRILKATADQGSLNQLSDMLDRAQNTFGEPNAGGLSSVLGDFFSSFQELANNPESTSARQVVLRQADALAKRFNQLASDLDSVSTSVQGQIEQKLGQANDLATQIAKLNEQIGLARTRGDNSGDLEDKRNELVRQLSTFTGATVQPATDGNGKATGGVNISIGGFPIVQGNQASPLHAQFTTVNGFPAMRQDGETYLLQGGEVAGLANAAALIGGYRSSIDTLASTLITAVNTQHEAGAGLDGSTGRALFAGTDAATIRLDPAVAADPARLAAATLPPAGQPVAPGNGTNATAIAAVANAVLLKGQTLSGFYAGVVSQVGADAKTYGDQATNQQQVLQQLNTLRGSVSGVNLDEEMTRMLQFQRGYQAAAKMLTVMDSMVDQVVNGLIR